METKNLRIGEGVACEYNFKTGNRNDKEIFPSRGTYINTLYSFTSLSYDRSIASSKASSSECEPVISLSISITLTFPLGNQVAAYVFFPVFPSFLSHLMSFLL